MTHRLSFSCNAALAAEKRPPRGAQFRPCIDIHQGKVKQIVGSTLCDVAKNDKNEEAALVTNFVSERPSSWFAELYEKDNLRGGHAIMLGPGESNRSAALEAVSAWPGGIQVGGGISPENAELFLEAGASHVIVTSYVFRDGRLDNDRLQKLVSKVGPKQIVLDLSCRKREGDYWVVTDRWQKFSSLKVCESTLLELAESCDEFLVHGVDVEGKQCGVDEDLIGLLGKWSPIPVTYAGGVKDLGDLEVVSKAGGGYVDVTVGSALDIFGGSLAYERVVEWHNQNAENNAASTSR
ncbi:hypothetical protein BSKO_12431 [Bryopsis sp. KO-2023]|nr:hypothetical protein BSKO_12431 [Bryopsis sp. KO-2023]